MARAAEPLGPGRWRVTWSMEHSGPEPLELQEVFLPHGRFRAEPRRFDPPLKLEPGHTTELTADVACDGAPGSTFENAFVLLRTFWRGDPWRYFVRLTVQVGEDSAPAADTETVFFQRIRLEG